MNPRNVELHVEELVLRGFSPADRFRIGRAVEQELGRLFAERGAPPAFARSAEISGLDGGSFEARSGSGAETIGAQVARTVYRGLGA